MHKAKIMATTNFHQLRVFHAVVSLGSFSRAAESLSVSQPAVSIQVRELERSLDSTLIHRSRSGLKLTDTGRTVYDYAQRIFALADDMQAAVEDIQGLRGARLTIGSSTTPGEYVLPWAIGLFQKLYPDIEVSLSIANTESIIERIRDRELDLGMVGSPVSMEGLSSFEYVSDEIALIVSPQHPLATKRGLRLHELEGEKFVMREPGSATRKTAEECLASAGVTVSVAMELGSNEAVKRAVAAGLGMGIVSKFGSAPDVAAGLIEHLAVDGWDCRRPLTVFYREDRHLPAAHRAFLEFLREERPLPPDAG